MDHKEFLAFMKEVVEEASRYGTNAGSSSRPGEQSLTQNDSTTILGVGDLNPSIQRTIKDISNRFEPTISQCDGDSNHLFAIRDRGVSYGET